MGRCRSVEVPGLRMSLAAVLSRSVSAAVPARSASLAARSPAGRSTPRREASVWVLSGWSLFGSSVRFGLRRTWSKPISTADCWCPGQFLRWPVGAGTNSDSRLELFIRGSDNALWRTWQTGPSSGPWSPAAMSPGAAAGRSAQSRWDLRHCCPRLRTPDSEMCSPFYIHRNRTSGTEVVVCAQQRFSGRGMSGQRRR